jgi:two-component system response regulator NreC
MAKIHVLLIIESELILKGIESVLSENEVIEIDRIISPDDHPIEVLEQVRPNIVILETQDMEQSDVDLINLVNEKYERISVLLIGNHFRKELIYKSIKAGAKGFLPNNTPTEEFIKAIYTLRNGYDYYSNSISHILINEFIRNSHPESNLGQQQINKLTERELEILKLWGESYTNTEISEKLFISVRTVESHKNHIMQKLNFKTMVDLFKFAIKNNIIAI